MAVVKPFVCIRPVADKTARVAALPYNVYNKKGACQVVKGNPLSFLNIGRVETQFGDDVDAYDSRVYDEVRKLLDCQIEEGVYVADPEGSYYLYELTMEGRSQTDIMACCSVDDYVGGVVREHKNTREDKELDRIRHVDATNAHTDPIFLAYRQNQKLKALVAQVKEKAPLYDFASEGAIRHRVWVIDARSMTETVEATLATIPGTCTTDGHHGAISAVKVGLEKRKGSLGYTGKEPFNYFLAVLFPDGELKILLYNRVIKDLNGLGQRDFLAAMAERFDVAVWGDPGCGEPGADVFWPGEEETFGVFLGGRWYCLRVKPELQSSDPVRGLDVSILRDQLLGPVPRIGDPRTDRHIDFIDGVRRLKELERRVSRGMGVAFSIYLISIEELLAMADAGLLIPPKSTWFEPKLRSELFIHGLR